MGLRELVREVGGMVLWVFLAERDYALVSMTSQEGTEDGECRCCP
jgi:hypothetical protein